MPVEAAHRADVGRLLGVAWELSGRDVTVKALRDALTRAGTSLEDVLVDAGGPLRDAAAEKANAAAAEVARRDRLTVILTEVGIEELIAQVAVARWLGPAEQAEDVARQVATAWQALPTRPGEGATSSGSTKTSDAAGMAAASTDGVRPVGLAVFAGRVLDDPHALDRTRAAGRALARIVIATCDRKQGAPTNAAGLSGGPADVAAVEMSEQLTARVWRSAWARVGVLCDQVSSTVLVLNLTLTGPNQALRELTAARGEPLWVTSRMTQAGCAIADASDDVDGRSRLVVRVCENPAVVEAAADELGESCPPLVCLYGRPSTAAWDVMSAVVAAGGRLLVTGDRDAAGKQITAEVKAAFPGAAAEWLPDTDGVFEEQRLAEFLADLT